MKIEIWSDVICPWCGIGQHRLDAALADFPQREEVEVIHRSFQLDPSFPAGVTLPVREVLRKKYRMTDAQMDENSRHIESLADADGLRPYKVGQTLAGNTRQAHELLALARAHGLEAEAWKRLYRAHFGEGRSIFTVDSLVELGVEIGLEAAEVRAALEDGRYAAQVLSEGREAQKLGANGVPFVVIDRRLGIAGAQSVDTFRRALRQAWRDNPVPLPKGEACEPDRC